MLLPTNGRKDIFRAKLRLDADEAKWSKKDIPAFAEFRDSAFGRSGFRVQLSWNDVDDTAWMLASYAPQ